MELPKSFAEISPWLEHDPVKKLHKYLNCVDNLHEYWSVKTAFPGYDNFLADFEINYDGGCWHSFFARDTMWIPITLSIVYMILVFSTQSYLKSREAFDLRIPQVFWNLGLAVFSIIGATRTVPYLVLGVLFRENGFWESYCGEPAFGAGGPSGLWTMLFIYSKIPELGDTFFIVLGKRKLMFLHWFHHVTVLIFVWHSYATRAGAGLWFIGMNYTVHAVMYSYYTVMTLLSLYNARAKRLEDPKQRDAALKRGKWVRGLMSSAAPVITIMQISQMVVGVAMNVMAIMYKLDPNNMESKCFLTRSNLLGGLAIYFSYFLLFASFAINRYVPCGKKSEPAAAKDVAKKIN